MYLDYTSPGHADWMRFSTVPGDGQGEGVHLVMHPACVASGASAAHSLPQAVYGTVPRDAEAGSRFVERVVSIGPGESQVDATCVWRAPAAAVGMNQ